MAFSMQFDQMVSRKSLHNPTETLRPADIEDILPDQLNESYELIEELFSSQVAEELNSLNPNGGGDSWMENMPLQFPKELTFKRGYIRDNVIDSNA